MCLIVRGLFAVWAVAELLTAVTELQKDRWKTWSISLPELSGGEVLIQLAVTHSSGSPPTLLAVNQVTAPSIDFSPDGSIQFTGLSLDLVAFAFHSPTCHISLTSAALDTTKLLVVGVLIPSLPSEGVTVRLSIYAHSEA